MRRGLRVADRLERLRHQSVIRRDHQDHDVGHMRPARAHRGESGVAGGIEKGDARVFVIDGVSADVLGDSAGFARGDARLANRIHQRRLAVIDVTHERDNRAARLEFLFLLDHRRRRRDDDLLDFVDAAAFLAAFHFENEAVLLANFCRDVRLDRLVRVARENVEVGPSAP